MDPHGDGEGDSSDDDADEDDRWRGERGASGHVVLVDASGPRDRVLKALEATYDSVRKTVLESPSQLVGVALYGTVRDDDKGLENVVQLFELKQPTVEDVLRLKKLCSDVELLQREYGVVASFRFSHALWQAVRAFSHCKKKLNSQTVTALGLYAEPDVDDRRAILQKLADLSALGIRVDLINASDETVPADSAYARDAEPIEPTNAVDEISSLLRRHSSAKSASASLKLYLGPELAIGVGVYHPCKAKNLPKRVLLHREDNDRVESSVTIRRSGDEGSKPVLNAELRAYQRYGERDIELTYGELMQLRKFGGAPRMKLLGFEPASILRVEKSYLKPSAFLYPDESAVEGSGRLFRCLRDRCIAKDRIPICSMVARWYSHPRAVALVPQKRSKNCPDGFHVVYLPYADNSRDVPVESPEDAREPNDEQLDLTSKIVGKLKIEYSADSFENPKLQTFYAALEALALEDEEVAGVEDATKPDLELQRKRIGSRAEQFSDAFGPFGVAAKRKTTDNSQQQAKRPSLEFDFEYVKARARNKEVHKFTVPQLKNVLKDMCNEKTALTSLKKDQLVNMVYAHCKTSCK